MVCTGCNSKEEGYLHSVFNERMVMLSTDKFWESFKCFNISRGASRNYKLVIIQFSDYFCE
jgi:hypothetical protein